MYLKKQVVVTDVMTYLSGRLPTAAQICGLRACWSTPIIRRRMKSGSFAIYRQETAGRMRRTRGSRSSSHAHHGYRHRTQARGRSIHHSEEQIALLQTITMAGGDGEGIFFALEVVLERVCEKTGWDYAQSWLAFATAWT